MPGQRDGPAAEVSHIRIECLHPGHRQDHRPHQRQTPPPALPHHAERIGRIQRQQHQGFVGHPPESHRANGQKPQQHHPPENPPQFSRPQPLHQKQRRQHKHCAGNDQMGESWVHHLQAFQCAQDRDRRGDRAVAKKQRRTAQQHQHIGRQPQPGVGIATLLLQEGQQGKDPALLVIIRPHDDADIFERHNEQQAPDNERSHSNHGIPIRMGNCRQRRLEGVERTGPDVAKDHPQRSERERQIFFGGAGVHRPVALAVHLWPDDENPSSRVGLSKSQIQRKAM